jgi:hypothetical protein
MNNIRLYRFASLIPIREKGETHEPEHVPIVTLASSVEEAQFLAISAGLILIGRITSSGEVIPIQ